MDHSVIRRRIFGTLASAAVALAGMTAAALPARADNNDVARALAAIAALAIIAKTIDDNRDRDDDRGNQRPPPVWNPRPHPQPQPNPEPARRILPRECAIELVDRGRRDVWYSRPCLRDEGVRADDLPRRCEAEVRIRGRNVTVYPRACLINAGFRPEGRRGEHENPNRW